MFIFINLIFVFSAHWMTLLLKYISKEKICLYVLCQKKMDLIGFTLLFGVSVNKNIIGLIMFIKTHPLSWFLGLTMISVNTEIFQSVICKEILMIFEDEGDMLLNMRYENYLVSDFWQVIIDMSRKIETYKHAEMHFLNVFIVYKLTDSLTLLYNILT